jgi:hypothetical protein
MSTTMSSPSYLDITLAQVRRATTCVCGRPLAAGERAGWARSTRRYVCVPCVKQALWSAVEREDS